MPRARGTSSRTPRPIDAVGHRQHGVGPGPVAAHLAGRPAPEHLAADEHVGQGVDMGGAQAVDVEGEVVASGLVARDAVGVAGVARRQHVVLDGVGVLGRAARWPRSWDRLIDSPVRTSPTAAARSGVGQMVERAPLVVGAPPAPVLERLDTSRRAPRWSEPRSRSPWRPACQPPRWGAVIAPMTMSTRLSTKRSSDEDVRCSPPPSSSRARSAAARPMKTMQISRRCAPQVGGDLRAALPQQLPRRLAGGLRS